MQKSQDQFKIQSYLETFQLVSPAVKRFRPCISEASLFSEQQDDLQTNNELKELGEAATDGAQDASAFADFTINTQRTRPR